MAAVKELLRAEADGTLSFGDYTLESKTKLEGFEHQGDIYKVKTFAEITKLERNGMFVYESVPGTAVENFRASEAEITFQVSGPKDAQFTLEMEADTQYEVYMNEVSAGEMKTNLSGKLSVSVELGQDEAVSVKIVKNRGGGEIVNGQLFALIRTKYNTLSDSQKAVADYILEDPGRVIGNTLSDTAYDCKVSEPTVLRFLRKIDFTSYQLFKISLAKELSDNTSEEVYEDVTFRDTTEQIVEKIIHSTVNSISDSKEVLNPDSIGRVVDKIIDAKKVLIIGMGASGSIATDLYHKLLKLRINAVCSNDAHMINLLSTNLDPEDLLIVISHSGESREVLDALALAKDQGCQVCAVTSYENPH